MIRINQVKLPRGHSSEDLRKHAARMLRIPVDEITGLEIARQSVDARRKPDIYYIYALNVEVRDEEKVLHKLKGRGIPASKWAEKAYRFPEPGPRRQKFPTVIVGMGPAGLFCGYFLALHGYEPILLERGRCVEERQRDVEAFWETGRLDPSSNVQFGEGGAGAFSDGKLNTLVKDKDGRNRIVLETLVKFGAKRTVLYEAKPHIGTDVLCGVVRGMREEILRMGGQVRFRSHVTDILIQGGRVAGVVLDDGRRLDCGQLVLAVGHSARDTFSMLYGKGVPMEAKPFAVGLRVEHPQPMINESQLGLADPGDLGAAAYKLAAQAGNGRGVYSFCMCPGGYVVNASSEEGRTAVNGMSYSRRDGENANSAIVVTVTPEDFGSRHPLAGIDFQRRLEEKAFALGAGGIPVQRYGDFRRSVRLHSGGGSGQEPEGAESEGQVFLPRCKGMYHWADVSRILPEECNAAIVDGMEIFGRQISGFDRPDACLSGVESRTSSPVRILRDHGMQSEIKGLYPCGEGAGYAGGILSAAMDGLRAAEAVAAEYAPSAQSIPGMDA